MPLSDLQRRVMSHLSIPRNVDDLAAAVRPYATVTDVSVPGHVRYLSLDETDTIVREDLAKNGWVKKLGRHEDPAKLVVAAQKDKDIMPFTDERAAILSRRLLHPERAWRMQGDLWMLTEEGLAQMHAPISTAPPKTPSEVTKVIAEEWARTLKGHTAESYNATWGGEDKPDGPSLTNTLLEDEFLDWCQAVSDECERVWGERPIAPMAGGASGYSDAYENSLLDAENQKTALGAVVDPWFMALSILAFTDADTGTTADDGTHKPTYTGYARKSVAGTDMPAASGTGGSVSNTSAIIFAACTAGSSVCLACGNTSATTVGTLRKWGDIPSTTISVTQTPAQFAVGAYTTTTT